MDESVGGAGGTNGAPEGDVTHSGGLPQPAPQERPSPVEHLEAVPPDTTPEEVVPPVQVPASDASRFAELKAHLDRQSATVLDLQLKIESLRKDITRADSLLPKIQEQKAALSESDLKIEAITGQVLLLDARVTPDVVAAQARAAVLPIQERLQELLAHIEGELSELDAVGTEQRHFGASSARCGGGTRTTPGGDQEGGGGAPREVGKVKGELAAKELELLRVHSSSAARSPGRSSMTSYTRSSNSAIRSVRTSPSSSNGIG